jgi:serine/threonine-protein kinase
LRVTPTTLLPGTIVGRYCVDQLLGTGQFGSVYEASSPQGARVALKCLHREGGASIDPHLVARFQREAALCRTLVSPHIAPVYEHGVDPVAGPFLVMRLLRGADLRAWFVDRTPLAPAAAVGVAVQICAGLAPAHRLGIVHRDLKPENVFLEEMGGGDLTAIVCDFGLAKICDDNGKLAAAGLTSTGAVLGTPYYMSPEQILDAKRVDQRSDVWALAMLLYHALAGRTALANIRSFPDLVFALEQGTVMPLLLAAPWVPPKLAEVVDAALQPLERRYPSIEHLERALLAAFPIAPRLRMADFVRVS